MVKKKKKNNFLAMTSFLDSNNIGYISSLYSNYKLNPGSINDEWRNFFESVDKDTFNDYEKSIFSTYIKNIEHQSKKNFSNFNQKNSFQSSQDSIRALMMIRAYRMRGHLYASLDPLKLSKNSEDPSELSPETYGFTKKDYERKIFIDNVLGFEYATIPEILEVLKRSYCSTIGIEFMHISDPIQRSWIQEKIECRKKSEKFTREGKRSILKKMIEAEGFEKFLDIKYKGTKRFGLDGSESLIPALEQIIKRGGSLGVQEIIFGMAHRGRLNVLSQVMSKSHEAIFHEFKGGSYKPDEVEGSGDVKYHLGASSDRSFDGNKVHLSLLPNPSHLEIVNPVVIGKVRAKQDHLAGITRTEMVSLSKRSKILPVLIHGDAAFSGQGVVSEMFALSDLKGYRVSGSLHLIVNNQIGFTTDPRFSRSSPYPSDTAKMIEALIFHVNGDDPEAVVHVAKIASEFRQIFYKPVVIDMFCYRRFGHNEGDEPSFTQPIMYEAIRNHKTTLSIYIEKLISENTVSFEEVNYWKKSWKEKLEHEFEKGTKNYKPNKADWLDGIWKGFRPADISDERRCGSTGVAKNILKNIGRNIVKIPEKFVIHKTIKRFLEKRKTMIEKESLIDWSTAEALAFGSLVIEGNPIRLSGQDVERGTFSQRHSVIYDQKNEERYIPLNNIQKGQAIYEVINSMLSEEAVLGFEYGYSLAEPNSLVLWEAQFGDFANGAQVIFDQFISSAERKWLRMSGIVCLLPHGFEGQGPEHSSARIERYLQLCAEDNIQVANCTTPANYFHILRRQIKRDFRKPLILITPKSLLRHRNAVSCLNEMDIHSSFHRVLYDDAESKENQELYLKKDSEIIRVIICSGKIYYDLYEERGKRKINNIYLLRIEQLYPFPKIPLINILSRFLHADIIWCQEEPKNMGSWTFIQPYFEKILKHIGSNNTRIRYVGRVASASPATGLMSKHLEQLANLLEEALSLK